MTQQLPIAVLLALLAAPVTARDDIPETLRSLTVDGVERRHWQIAVPRRYGADEPAPLVVEFHGTGGTPESQMELSGFPALAEEQGFLLVTPVAQYPRPSDERLTWNVDLRRDTVDDVAFVAELLDHVTAEYAVDTSRIYAVGFSGGARMSSRLACDLSDEFAAIGAVAGLRYPEDCQPSRPVPVIAFHGRRDVVNHFEHQPDSPDYWRMGVEQALNGWVRHNRCDPDPETTRLTETDTLLSYQDCRDGADVLFYRSDVANHTWPGTPLAAGIREQWGQDVVSDVPATRLIWEFFRQHRLPED